MRAALLLALGSACAIPDQKLGAYACAGAPEPSTAPAEITVSGTVFDPFATGGGGVQGLTVVAMPTGGFTTMTDTVGNFDGQISTGGTPSSDFLKITGSGFVDGYFYPAEDVATALPIGPLEAYMPGELAMIGSGVGIPVGSDTEQLVISVEDCAGDSVEGATITVDSGSVIYINQNQPDPTATMTDARGAAFVLGVTASPVTIAAMTPQQGFHAHSVPVMPGTLTQTAIQP